TVGSLRSLLAARTGGNPLFLEESMRSLVEMGALAGERGGYRLTRAGEAIEGPSTGQAILAARIGRPAPADNTPPPHAALVGKDVPCALLQAIAEEPEESTRQGLGRLQAAEFLYEARLFPDLEYTFKHALTLEVAYGTLLLERRREIHQRVLTALESRTP